MSSFRRISFPLLVLVLLGASFGIRTFITLAYPSTQNPVFDTYGFNAGSVRQAVELSDGRFIVAGGMRNVSTHATGGLASIDKVTGVTDETFPAINDFAFAVEPDGAGGAYVGGSFTLIGGTARTSLAQLNSAGVAGALDVSINGAVRAVLKSGDTLYIGGDFTSVGGQTRNRLAAIDLTGNGGAGSVTAWDPNAGGSVYDMQLDGSTLYFVGAFTTVNGATTRNRAAAVSTVTGTATSWNPVLNAPSSSTPGRSIVLDTGNDVAYVGGVFDCVGGDGDATCGEAGESTRQALAAFSTADAGTLVSGFDASLTAGSGTVRSLLLNGSTLYVGGSYSTIGGQARSGLAELTTADGTATAWNPASTVFPYRLLLDGTTLYAAGVGVEAVSTVDGSVSLIKSVDNRSSYDLVLVGANIWYVGDFQYADVDDSWDHVVMFNTDGTLADWHPTMTATGGAVVHAMVVDEDADLVYIGGTFTSVGGQTRNRLAAISLVDGSVTAWDPEIGGSTNTVLSLALDKANNTIYAGGSFTCVGGDGDATCGEAGESTRNRLAAFDLTTGVATSWNPNATSGQVSSMVLNGTDLYVGGSFSTVGGQARAKIAKLSTGSNTATSWNPGSGGTLTEVARMALSGTTLYIAGSFTAVGGQLRNHAAALDTATDTNNATAWNPNLNARARALSIDTSTNTVYLGGEFTTVGGQTRSLMAEVDMSAGSVTTWDPYGNGALVSSTGAVAIYVTQAMSDKVVVGGSGDFLSIGADKATFVGNLAIFSDAVETTASGGFAPPHGSAAGLSKQIRLTVPNGGETLAGGSVTRIEWTVPDTGRVDLVSLSYSLDEGETWHPILEATQNMGFYDWTVPNVSSERALVRVDATDLAAVYATDTSNRTFDIVGTSLSAPEATPGSGPASAADAYPEMASWWNKPIRSKESPAVYFADQWSATRRPFPNAATFRSYYDSFDAVQVVEADVLETLPIGPFLLPKSGVVLVKLETDPTVYVLQDNPANPAYPLARAIPDEPTARALFGVEWSQYVLDVPRGAFSELVVLSPLDASFQTDASALKSRAELTR